METEESKELEYLVKIIQAEDIGNMGKLASLSVINSLLQKGEKVKKMFMKTKLTSTLLAMLEYGLTTPADPSDSVLVSVAMETLTQFTRLPVVEIESLIKEPVIRCLLQYIDSSSMFYQYPSSTKTIMTSLCEGKQLMGKVKVVSMASEPLSYIHRHADYTFTRVPDRLKLCKLMNTETDTEVDITDSLIQQGAAWKGEFPGDVTETNNVWQNIIVTKVIGGGMFWAQVGDDAIKKVMDMQTQLNSDTVDYVNKSHAQVGECVLVKGDIMGCSSYLRAEVKGYNDCYAEVFLVDFGHTLTIHDRHVYALPENLSIKKVKGKVSLCSIDGISPPPQDEELVYNASAILINLCRQSLPAGENVCKLEGVDILFKFLEKCEIPKLQAQILTVLYNMVSISRKLCSKLGARLILLVLGIIKSCLEQKPTTKSDSEESSVFTESERLLIVRCLMMLTNIIYMNQQYRDMFYQNQGIELVMRIIFLVRRRDALYEMSLKLLKVYTGPTEDGGKDPQSNSTAAMNFLKQQMAKAEIAPKQEPLSDEKRVKVQPQATVQPKATLQQAKEILDDSDNESVHLESISHKVPQRPQRAHKLKSPPTTRYYLGSRVDFYDDDLHEIIPHSTSKDIHQLSFSHHICGMLNNGKGGSVYFGIDEDHVVFGLEVSRDNKDMFRLGVDRLLSAKITPTLLHCNYSIKIFPVYDPIDQQIIPDRYVMEICIPACRGVTYMFDDVCYYRVGSDSIALSKQELRNMIAMEEESLYKDEIIRLAKMKEELIQSLHT